MEKQSMKQKKERFVMFEEAISKKLVVAAATLIFGCGFQVSAVAGERNSGFLGDYSQLEAKKDALGLERRIWVSPGFKAKVYQKILLEPVSYFPAPEPSDKVSMGTLEDIRHYIDGSIRKEMAGVVPLADAPGAGVVRVRIAITAASVEDMQLKPYQLVPIALAFTAAKEAAGEGHREARLAVETEMSDSVTGDPLARSVRDAKGLELKSDQALTLHMVKPRIDTWLQTVGQQLRERFGAKQR